MEHSLSAGSMRRQQEGEQGLTARMSLTTVDISQYIGLSHPQDKPFSTSGLGNVLEWGCSEVTELYPGPEAPSHLHFQLGQ